jgi:hypothetical protein
VTLSQSVPRSWAWAKLSLESSCGYFSFVGVVTLRRQGYSVALSGVGDLWVRESK